MAIYEVDPNEGAVAQPLPLEPVCVYANGGQEKLTTDTGSRIRFHSHLALAKEIFVQKGIVIIMNNDPLPISRLSVNCEPPSSLLESC